MVSPNQLSLSFFFLFLNIYLFIWLCWVLVGSHGIKIQWFHQISFPSPFFFLFLNIYLFIWLRWVLVGSRGIFYCSVPALQLWCSPAARGILVPWSGIKPMSPALQGRCWTTGPPGGYLAFPLLQERVIWGGVGEMKSMQGVLFLPWCRVSWAHSLLWRPA